MIRIFYRQVLSDHDSSHLDQYYDNGAEVKVDDRQCDFKFNSTSNKHFIKTNTGEFSCLFCPYISKYKGNFKVHMMTHSGEKPYACKFCPYRGTQKNNLDRHMKIHTGEKPYPCTFCPYRGTQKTHLERHLLTHIN